MRAAVPSGETSPFALHGGRIDRAQSRYPDAPGPWLDLSTGISPFTWSGGKLAACDLRALPCPAGLLRLEEAAAAAFGAARVTVAAVPGSEIGLRLLRTLGLPGPCRFVAPTYGAYQAALPGAVPVQLDGLDAAADRGGTIVLCNPNNPDGRVLPPARLLQLAERLRRADGWLIVDEAFADARPAASVLPHLTGDEHVLVSRSFGKFFGLAGLRLGFLCGRAGMIGALRRRLGDWPVSTPAIAIGTAAYTDRGWQTRMRTRIATAADALDDRLVRHGLRPIGGCPLFRLVETPRAAALFDRLAAAGILVRPFDYAPDWLRLGLPANRAELARLDRALADG